MSDLLIRKLDDETRTALRLHAAATGRSMSVVARSLLKESLKSKRIKAAKGCLGERIHNRFKKLGGLNIPNSLRTKDNGKRIPDFNAPDYDHS